MELIKFLINNDLGIDQTNRLYYRLSKNAICNDSCIELPKNESVSLNTYYNVISSKYFHYANIINPTIKIEYIGNIKCELHLKTMTSDVVIGEATGNSIKESTLNIVINSDIIKNSLLYITITALDNSKFLGGGFYCDNTPRNIKLGAVICTYHRETFVKNNLLALDKLLINYPILKSLLGVYVIDNGKTLKKSDLPEYVHLIPNENTGGSGGFTRGLRELIKDGSYTNFLFMDDDISFEPTVIERTISLLSVLKEEYKDACIGGTMLIKDNPTIQHEFGAYWTGSRFKPNGNGIDLATTYGLLVDEQYFDTDYNAWWYCCMPTSVVEKKGYPLDMLFVQFDDVEYGLRNDNEFIHINGIGVWHENFNNKYNPAYEYFIKRNNMIVMSRYSNKGFFTSWLKYVIAVSKALFQQRYYIIDIVKMAYDDFLQGADYVKQIKGADKLKELSKYCPTQMPAEEVANQFNINLDDELVKTISKKEHRFIETITLNSYLLPSFTYQDIAVVNMVNPTPIDFYKTKQVVHYNSYTNKAFITKINKKMLFKGLNSIIGMFFKLATKYKKASETYKNL